MLHDYIDEIQGLTRCCKCVVPFKDKDGMDAQQYLMLCFDDISAFIRFMRYSRYQYKAYYRGNWKYVEACPLVANMGDPAPTEYETGFTCTIWPDCYGTDQIEKGLMSERMLEDVKKYICIMLYFPTEHECPYKEGDNHCPITEDEGIGHGTNECYSSKYSHLCAYDEYVLEKSMDMMRKIFGEIDGKIISLNERKRSKSNENIYSMLD